MKSPPRNKPDASCLAKRGRPKRQPMISFNELPPTPDLEQLPAYTDRSTGEVICQKYFFPVSRRSFERWALPWRIVNGAAICPTKDFIEACQSRLDAAPKIAGRVSAPGGRR